MEGSGRGASGTASFQVMVRVEGLSGVGGDPSVSGVELRRNQNEGHRYYQHGPEEVPEIDEVVGDQPRASFRTVLGLSR